MDAFLGGQIWNDGNYSITSGAGAHMHGYQLGKVNQFSLTCTLTGTPAFSNFFAGAALGLIASAGVTFSGSATGTRYLSHKNALIETGGGGANFYPGNGAGSTATGGQYA